MSHTNYSNYLAKRVSATNCCCQKGAQCNTGAQGNTGNSCLPQYGPQNQEPYGIKPDCIGNIYVEGANPQKGHTVGIWVSYGTGVNDWHRIENIPIPN